MTKLSSSDLDPHQTDEDRTGLDVILSKKSVHFADGTWVQYDGTRYRLVGRAGRFLMVTDEDGGGWVIDNPMFMR